MRKGRDLPAGSDEFVRLLLEDMRAALREGGSSDVDRDRSPDREPSGSSTVGTHGFARPFPNLRVDRRPALGFF